MRAAEQRLMERGETEHSLMARAGVGAADWVWRLSGGRSVTVLCGPGNNGGDGYVIARSLAERGVDVSVVAPMEPATEAAIAAAKAWGGSPVANAHGHVLVDCLFGTGLSRPLSDDLAAQLAHLAGQYDKRVAVDMPSGVESDSGQPLNDGLPNYGCTIALGAWKPSHWLMPSSAKMGRRVLVDIGIGEADAAARLSERISLTAPVSDAHKYSRGMVLIVGGAMPGATVLAGQAALHAGAGYVALSSNKRPEGLPIEVVHRSEGLDAAMADERIDAILVGPGLGRSDDAERLLRAVLRRNLPTILDADALTLLTPEMLEGDASRLLCTPHEGELATLCDTFGVKENDKLSRARALHEKSGMTILAKGADNILVGDDGIRFFPPASAWLSTAGTGDVLAGIAASRMATSESAASAAQQAVHIHSEAARLAGPAFSASDLAHHVSLAYARFL
ncbi:NAD(P)HX epimerase / NAD(P)HX dehydratase [Aurantiacibacter gangjinensis]|uniref:ADP-dependent (S)-NAD(P)H-hydrate dehydratase n=2 Tax=Aurantiacibacter gangjinensis TaxID=502682 RepID=A0A0G9MT08_9SPHN|nr:NAD(P)HX epimerase / NAD(P)HX dehydratase [Aurantiacibacter gangjinensis]KLE33644.1 hypothetical protein AAW01_03155 [Aurantiacibacter gangjinensis]